jgi:hypothetical protein
MRVMHDVVDFRALSLFDSTAAAAPYGQGAVDGRDEVVVIVGR